MAPLARTDDENWGSEGDLENGQATPHKPRSVGGLTPTPASPAASGTAAGSEGNDGDTEAAEPPMHDRYSAEAIVLQKTGWLVLRSTAHNMNNVLRNAGVSGLRVHQMYDSDLDSGWRVRCLVLLYKWAPDRGDGIKWNPENTPNSFAMRGDAVRMEDDSTNASTAEDIMFCCQSMDNASATQALIMSVMNIPEDQDTSAAVPFRLGEELTKLKAYMKPVDPVLRTAAICSSQVVRDAHNKAAREQPGGHPDLLDEDGRLQNIILADELWMYTVFIPGAGDKWVYELHGVADAPKVMGFCNTYMSEPWTSVAMDNIEGRVETFQDHNTPFLLFAVTSDTKEENSLPRIPRKSKKAESDMESSDESGSEESEDMKDESSTGNMNSSGDRDSDSRRDNSEELDEETVKEEVERIRATHNYDAFFIEMMKLMASRGDLNALIRSYPEYQATSDEE